MQRSTSSLVVLAAVVVAGGSLAWTWNGGRSLRAAPESGVAVPQGNPDLEELSDRVARLERRVETLLVALQEPKRSIPLAQDSAPSEPHRGLGDEDMRQTVEALVRDTLREHSLPQYVEVEGSRFVPGGNPDPEGTRRLVDENVALANDWGRTPQERLQALRFLRFQQHGNEEARLLVLDAMMHLGVNAAEGSVRADVWRQMSGMTDARLLPALLDALAYDPVAEVREEAAETLIDFLPDPTVMAALQQAANNDPDGDVRRQAAAWRRRR